MPSDPEYDSAHSLIRSRALMLAGLAVVIVPGILLYAWWNDSDAWWLTGFLVLGSGLLAVPEHTSLMATLSKGARPAELYRALLVCAGLTAIWGIVALLGVSFFADTGGAPGLAAALGTPAGWLALLAWQFASVNLGWVTGLSAGLIDGAPSGRKGRHGLSAVLSALLVLGLAVLVLLASTLLLGWVGVGLAVVVGALAMLWLWRVVHHAVRDLGGRQATEHPR